MLTTPIPTPLPGPSPRIRSWRVSRASHKAPRPPKPHNLCHEPLLQDTRSPGLVKASTRRAMAWGAKLFGLRGRAGGLGYGPHTSLRNIVDRRAALWVVGWLLLLK